jgi:hypothetical protein
VLKKQLENYVILKRHATTGKPIYGPESAEIADHRLDALISALGAYTLELGAYSKNNLAMSSPEFITKERIEAALENEQGNGWFPIGEQTTAPVTVQLLNIKRGAGNTPVPMRERENKHKPNLFEEIFERATFSPSTSAVDYEYGTPSVGNSRRKEPYSIGRRRR